MQRPFLSEGLRRRLGIAGSAVALAVIAAFFILPALAERTTSVATVLDQVDRLNSRDGKRCGLVQVEMQGQIDWASIAFSQNDAPVGSEICIRSTR